jgi:hypothetical protein
LLVALEELQEVVLELQGEKKNPPPVPKDSCPRREIPRSWKVSNIFRWKGVGSAFPEFEILQRFLF